TLQANAQNLDISALQDILQLPIDIDGLANATAFLGGTLANPLLRGQIELDAAAINNTPITAATTGFIYQNARLGLESKLTANAPENPLTLKAQIPYAFNFMEVQPETQDITIDINVQDEGLALLNIFNKEVAWESGSGQFNLSVGGTLAGPEIEGAAILDNAVLSAAILPEPLTNVTGRATFAGERVIIETLQGSFSDGQLSAAGTFPLLYPIISGAQLTALTAPTPPPAPEPTESNSDNIDTSNNENASLEPTPETSPPITEELNQTEDPLFPQPLAANLPLTVNFQNIDLTLDDDLYSGGVNGQVIVGGSALLGGPQIGGQVILSDGQVVLPDNEAAATGVDLEGDTQTAIEADSQSQGGIIPQFRDLRLTLGNSVRIVQGNLLNFVADGTLLLNGPPTDLEPEGVINLRSGRVSLFTTLFRLRGSNNTAQFTPELGIQNPFLNVALRASVPEVNTSAALATTPFVSAEVADNSNIGFDNPGSLQTIRVRASVNGPADAIFENLELSSSPPRDENQLIALIGGGFVTALESTVGSLSGNGDSFEGLLNLVSGTILTSVQDFVGNTLSLSEFNLFPVTSASRTQSEEDNETGLDVAASVGFDVTEDASLSVSKILTDSSNPEFSTGYRLTDALTVRGTTNFDDINQVLLEYELRF
ncbi:MAG: translocation/assembly module TamB domain-containing protein, partial [Cyanobacteria bacterium J06598_3]